MNELKDIFRLRISDFDSYDNILPDCVLDLFQDVAGKHANLINIGFDDLKKDNKIWIVLKTRFTILKQPLEHTSVTIKTWPTKPSRIDSYRYYEMYNEQDELCLHGVSQWIVCDATTRRILKINDLFSNIEDYNNPPSYDKPFEKLVDFDCSKLTPNIIRTSYFDLDHNKHVNNTKYAKYIIEGVKELQDVEIKEFEINYLHELQKDEEIKVFSYQKDNVVYVKGCNGAITSFLAKVTL